MKKWKIAIVGAGYMAQEHARAFASLNNVEIVGVCGRTLSKAEELAANFNTVLYKNIKEMYDATQADVVVVAVNELSMLDVCTECFNHPWLCFLEKPVGVDLPEAEKILALSVSKNTKAYVALNRRSYASTRQGLNQLMPNDSARLISITDQQDMNAAREFGQPERIVRNYMYANSIHLIDYLHIFGRGEILSVESTVPWTPEAPGFVVATVRYSSGDVGVYQAVWNGPGPWSVTVTNSQVRIELRPLEKLLVQQRGERISAEISLGSIDKDFKPGLRYQAEQIVASLEGGEPHLATIDTAVASMRLCARIYGLN